GIAARAIFRGAKRQAQLINDLLDVGRIVSGKLRLDRGAVDLEDTIRDAVQMVQAEAEAKRITIVIDADRSAAPIHGDATRLQQITWNLVANAVKFTPEGGNVHVRLRQVGDEVELAVTDTGQGIAPDFLDSVFAPFRQADAS